MIILVASEKGGTGKTTIATHLAILRAEKGKDVLLIDADPQQSSIDFSMVRNDEGHKPEITCSALTGSGIGSELRKLAPKFDDVIVDVGGRDSTTLRSALLVADTLVIPFLPSQLDSWGLERMNAIVGELLALNDCLRTIAFLNKVDTNPKINLTEETKTFAKNLDYLTFHPEIMIGYRVAFRRSIAEGMAITELSKTKEDLKAIREIINLYNEVFKNA